MSDTSILTDAGLPPLAVSIISGAVRHIAGAAGAALMTHGVATADQEKSFEQIAGGAVALALALGWSAVQKTLAKRRAVAAVATVAAAPK